MNRDTIKYIAILAMAMNHVALVFFEPGTWIRELFLDIGYFTAPVMCYFLVEGYRYTRSIKKYGERLFLFALLSEIPYCLAFSDGEIFRFSGMNMIFTLFLCFLIIRVMYEVTDPYLRSLCIAGVVAISIFSDWGIIAPIFTVLFVKAGDKRREKKKAFIWGTLLFGCFNLISAMEIYSIPANLIHTLGSMAGPMTAGVFILSFYNGKKSENHQKFAKWFFYWFYPLHLIIIGILRIMRMYG